MNQNLFLLVFYPFINLFLIISFLLPKQAICIDTHFLACNPKTCGDGLNINFPFYIQGQQQNFCGYPGFNVSCLNGHSVINLQGSNYIIHQISYETQTFRVSNTAVFNTRNTCIPPFQNTSFLLNDKFKLYSNQTELVFLYHCNSSLLGGSNSDLMKYKVNCSTDSASNSTLSMFKDDPLLGSASTVCENAIVAAVDVDVDVERGGESSASQIQWMLERGFLLNWVASNCTICQRSGGKCGFDFDMVHFRCFCPDRPHAWHCVPGATVAVAVIILLSCVVLRQYIRRHGSSNLKSPISSSGLSSKSEIELGVAYFGIPIFSYAELEKATRNFDSEKELGDGGYGTVYYGKLQDGREVAVKRLYEHNCKRVEQFLNEIKILTRLRHRNLVSLYGCTSRRSRELLLVYEYIPNGTVADHLHGDRADSSPLTWPIRMSIAIETAAALAYLHASDIIHRDVKTNNILLDNSFCVKVADFGLSRLFPNDVTHVSTAPQGTPGYVDPEYHQCYQLTDKSDVYSFGVVLIELISSMAAVDFSRHRDEINLANFAVNKVQKSAFEELIDPCFWYKSDDEVRRKAVAVGELAFRCLQQDKEMRPAMDEVLEELKIIEGGEGEGEHMEKEEEVTVPPPSPPDCVEESLLKNIRLPPSPDTVTAKWSSSCSTTPHISS
ncbi:LEAF RUST 10 DISEASE-RESISTANCEUS RECEPTOR-LIKE PROTEIN KINASE-like 1.2 isoform X3 [Euphorbia lathyris]|uniref:LEAF RUST 10 DISEASE-RESISTANCEUS RECEPTOR-LIKE PROTEIN KINASE-like 1.2 isoform X3 n=1 Tax=Euphorbia lathyris TaxID=212925 RepID=UPI003313A7E3